MVDDGAIVNFDAYMDMFCKDNGVTKLESKLVSRKVACLHDRHFWYSFVAYERRPNLNYFHYILHLIVRTFHQTAQHLSLSKLCQSSCVTTSVATCSEY